MRQTKKILKVLLIVLIVVQFIRPARNVSRQLLATDITNTVPVPDTVLTTLRTACYDCHSNNTRYPWYTNIQPVAWFMANHIKAGKTDLNFSEFGSYFKRKQANKLRSINESVNEGSMPLSSYTLMHTNARLTERQRKAVTDWAMKTKDSLTAKWKQRTNSKAWKK